MPAQLQRCLMAWVGVWVLPGGTGTPVETQGHVMEDVQKVWGSPSSTAPQGRGPSGTHPACALLALMTHDHHLAAPMGHVPAGAGQPPKFTGRTCFTCLQYGSAPAASCAAAPHSRGARLGSGKISALGGKNPPAAAWESLEAELLQWGSSLPPARRTFPPEQPSRSQPGPATSLGSREYETHQACAEQGPAWGGPPGCLWDGPKHGPALGALWQDGSCHWLTKEQGHWEIPD